MFFNQILLFLILSHDHLKFDEINERLVFSRFLVDLICNNKVGL